MMTKYAVEDGGQCCTMCGAVLPTDGASTICRSCFVRATQKVPVDAPTPPKGHGGLSMGHDKEDTK